MTTRTVCVGCDTAAEIEAQMADVSEIGTVVRCAACDNALIRVAPGRRAGTRYWLDLRGVEYLQIPQAA